MNLTEAMTSPFIMKTITVLLLVVASIVAFALGEAEVSSFAVKPTYFGGQQQPSYIPTYATTTGQGNGFANNNNKPNYVNNNGNPITSSSTAVAFSATRASSYALSAPSFVKFEQTLTDIGYGWDGQASTFNVS